MGAALVFTLLMVGLSASFAQTATPEAQPTRIHSDLRINDQYELGGLGVYCENSSGQADLSYADNGAITVWSVGGQRIIYSPESDLTGMSNTTNTANSTEEVTMQPTNTRAANQPFQVIWLGSGAAPYGAVNLYQVGTDSYLLTGVLSDGKPFQFTWNGCDVFSENLTTEAPYVAPANVRRAASFMDTGVTMNATGTRTATATGTRTTTSTRAATQPAASATPSASSTP